MKYLGYAIVVAALAAIACEDGAEPPPAAPTSQPVSAASSQPAPETPEPPDELDTDFEAEATRSIDADNFEAELDALERELEEDEE